MISDTDAWKRNASNPVALLMLSDIDCVSLRLRLMMLDIWQRISAVENWASNV